MDNALALSMLAVVLTYQDKAQDGVSAVQRAISLEPDVSYHYYAYSFVLMRLTKYEQAIQEAENAIRLEPDKDDYYAHLSSIYLHLKEWQKALDATDTGLELNPQNENCANMRALALRQMGRKEEATSTIDGLLGRDPENAASHANQGWSYLHNGDHKQALVHFSEALRLQPGLEWARVGMLEALKARNIIYRMILAYYLWISRFKSNTQWGLIIGAFVGIRIVRAIAITVPALAPFLSPLVTLYIIFAFSSWIASPLFNLFLMFDPFGRMILNEREKQTSYWVGLTLLTALVLWISGMVLAIPSLGSAALGAFILILPVSGLAHARTKRTRLILGTYVVLLVLAGFLWFMTAMTGLYDLANTLANIFLIGWILNSWIASFLISRDRA